MIIERFNNEIVIRVPSDVGAEGLKQLINHLKYREATRHSKARQKDVDELVRQMKRGWWQKNRARFI